MFEIKLGESGEIVMSGRLDASQADKAQVFLDGVANPEVIDLKDLDYISSAGLAVLLRKQKQLIPSGGSLRIINVNSHIHDVFRYSGFDRIFQVESAGTG